MERVGKILKFYWLKMLLIFKVLFLATSIKDFATFCSLELSEKWMDSKLHLKVECYDGEGRKDFKVLLNKDAFTPRPHLKKKKEIIGRHVPHFTPGLTFSVWIHIVD